MKGMWILVVVGIAIQFIVSIPKELFIIVAIISVLFYYFYWQEQNKLPEYPSDEFGPIIIDHKEIKKFLGIILKRDSKLYLKYLALHHLRESFYIILNSKNQETIKTRIEFVIERLHDLKSMNIPKDELEKIEKKFNELFKKAQTTRYTNQLEAYIDKINTLKTKKAKEKYYMLAKDLIQEAKTNKETEQVKISDIEQKLDSLIV